MDGIGRRMVRIVLAGESIEMTSFVKLLEWISNLCDCGVNDAYGLAILCVACCAAILVWGLS